MTLFPYPDDDPEVVTGIARTFRQTSTNASSTSIAANGVAHELTTTWKGQAGLMTAESVSRIATALSLPVQPLLDAAGLLDAYATVLETARGDIRELRVRYRQEQADFESAVEPDLTGKALQMYRYERDDAYSNTLSAISIEYDDVLETVDDAARTLGGDLTELADGAGSFADDLVTGEPTLHGLNPDGFDGDFTPQGFTFDPVTGQYIETSYDGDDQDSRSVLTLSDAATDSETLSVLLADANGAEIGKSGGVAVNGDELWVIGSGGYLYRYSMRDIQALESGDTATATSRTQVDDTAYVSYHDGSLYVGDWNPDGPGKLYRYDVDHNGNPIVTGDNQFALTPKNVQGLTFHDGQYVFSQSHGRYNDSHLSTMDMDDDGSQYEDDDEGNKVVTIPNMSEGLTRRGNQIIVSHESGAEQYSKSEKKDGFVGLTGKGKEPRDDASITEVDDLD